MSDDVDLVQARLDVEIAAALTRISGSIPDGVRGACDECGEDMPRLVGGRCGYCRDGRRPPLDRYPIPAPIAPVQPRLDVPVPVEAAMAPASGAPVLREEDEMPNPVGSRTVTFVARGKVLEAIEALVAGGASTAAATASLAEAGVRQSEAAPVEADERLLLDLATVSLGDLLDEVRARCERVDQSADLLARVTAAEEKLAAITSVIAPAGDAS